MTAVGNTYKEARRNGDQFAYEFHTYWDGMAEGKENIAHSGEWLFLRRAAAGWSALIDFSKPQW